MLRVNVCSVILAATLTLLAPACGGKSDPRETAAPPAEEKAAETPEANGPEAWFTPAEANTPWCPPNPNIKMVSVDELPVPCNGGKRAENVVAFTADIYGWGNGPRLALASVDGKYWAYLGVEGSGPEFSPDGTKIAYTNYRRDVGLYVINADGSGKKLIYDDYSGLTGFAFTPDSRAVVYTASITERTESKRTYGIFLADADGSGRRLVYSSEERLANPSLPASGKKIAFEKGKDIYVINGDGSSLRRVTGPNEENEYAGDVGPAFSPDGSKIAFCSGDVGCDDDRMTFDIYVVNADGTGRRNLAANDGPDWLPSFSHDGKRIVFYSWKRGIIVADVETFKLRRLPHTGGTSIMEDMAPCFSPDDGKIAYDPEVGSTATRHIYVISADGTDDTTVSPGGKVHSTDPCFSPMRVDGVLLDTYGRVIEEGK
jgi:Tol biopolymer transport system component